MLFVHYVFLVLSFAMKYKYYKGKYNDILYVEWNMSKMLTSIKIWLIRFFNLLFYSESCKWISVDYLNLQLVLFCVPAVTWKMNA